MGFHRACVAAAKQEEKRSHFCEGDAMDGDSGTDRGYISMARGHKGDFQLVNSVGCELFFFS